MYIVDAHGIWTDTFCNPITGFTFMNCKKEINP